MGRYSKASIDWLRSIEKERNIKIQSGISSKGEYKIPSPKGGYYSVDGYCHKTKTVYEFQGDYFHGNPSKYHPDDMNKTVGKTFGELYRKTIERENYIRSLGYELVVKWETPIKKD